MLSKENFEFTFEDNRKFIMLKQDLIELSPNLYSKTIKNNQSKIIKVPKYIGFTDFNDFTEIYQSYISRLREFNNDQSFVNVNLITRKYNINIAQLIQISEFFENSSFSKILIKDCILGKNNEKELTLNQTLNINNSIALLYLGYNKLREINYMNKTKDKDINNEDDLENVWLELFMKTLDIIGTNLNHFFNPKNNINKDYSQNQLWSLDNKIIDELYEKFCYNLISNNYILEINNGELNINYEEKTGIIKLDVLEEIVNFLVQKRNQNDFFYLLSNEYFRMISEENINELNNLPNPTFVLKININDIDDYYEEYSLNNLFSYEDYFKLILIVYYKKNEDTFNVSIKLSKNNINIKPNFDIMTFLSLATIEELNNRQINIKSLSNNKSMYEIFKITNFIKSRKNLLINNDSDKNDYFTFKLFLKPCYIYILLSNYLYYNLNNLSKNENISKLNKNLLNIIISKYYLNRNEEENLNNNYDFIVECLINWLNDEINIVEDISDIIKSIKWENVSLPKIFEFFIKYSSNFSSDDIEYIFSKSLLKILKKFIGNIESLSQEILKAMTITSNKINYISIFSENKKIKKFNLFELISQRRYFNSELNSNNNEKKYKTTNNSFLNTIDKKEDISCFQTRELSKNNSNYKKKNKYINKREIQTCKGRSPIKLKIDESTNNKNAKNISFNSNNICYNNYFSNYNNNFNINIRLDNKVKKVQNPKTINTRKIAYYNIRTKKNKNELISRNKKSRITDLTSDSRTKQREQNSSYINTINLKKKLENLHNSNMNKTINIKNLKLLQNRITKKPKDISRNEIYNNFNTKTYGFTKNKTNHNINDSSSISNIDKDNPEKTKSNISKNKDIINKNVANINKNKFKLKEILKLAGKDKKRNHFIFNLKSLKKGAKK